LAATIVGGHDTVAGTEINARLVGTLVLAAGLVLIAGGAGLRRGEPLGRALAQLAALLGVALGVLTFLAQVVNDEPDSRLVLWAAIILVSASAGYTVRRLTPREERAQSPWKRLPILKSVISLGLAISIAQFWYTSIYLPTTAPASLTLESKIEQVGETDGQLVVTGSVVVRNTSGTRVNVLGSTLELSGEQLGLQSPDQETFRKGIRDADRRAIQNADRHTGWVRRTRITHGRLVDDGTYLEPGEVMTVPILTRIPMATRYDVLYLDVWLAIARGRVLAVETEEPEVKANKGSVVVITPVPEAGWLRQLTRGDRFVRIKYSSTPGSATIPEVRFTPGRGPSSPSGFHERLSRFYGFSATSSQALVSLRRR
jgi:hypothetical protein